MITVRNAGEGDLAAILAIYNDAILTTTAVYDYTPHTLEMRQQWYAAKVAGRWPVVVADDDGEVVGFSSLGPFRQWAAYKYSVENSIYVASQARGRGIGKLLLAPLIDAARSLEMHAVIAGIDADNEASQRLHRAFGFVQVARFNQVGYKFGRWLDLTCMQLLLDTPDRPSEG